jgi:hypothetical protein
MGIVMWHALRTAGVQEATMVANAQPIETTAPQVDTPAPPKPLPPLQPTSDFVYMTTLLGMPASMALAFATMLLALSYGEGAQITWWLGLAAAWGGFFAVMGAAWLGQANETQTIS